MVTCGYRRNLTSNSVSGPAGRKKLEDLKEKYQKACRKLNQTHNEYVLLLAEAAEYERDIRTVLFPGKFQIKHWETL